MSIETADDLGWELDDDWYFGAEPELYVDPYTYVMGMDPGGTTGIAMLRIETENDNAKPELVYLHQIEDGRYGFKDYFYGSHLAENVIAVSEKWRERNVKGANREPQYIEGGIHMLWGEESVVWQYPDVKDVITDEYLQSQNLWTPGMPHQMDALRHALAYLRNSGHSATLDTLNPDSDSAPIAQPGQAEESQLDPQATESAEPGEGTPEGIQGFMEAMKALVEAVEQVREDAEGLEDALTTQAGIGGYDPTPEEDETVKRTKRERNGAFAGYNPTDYESGGVTLLDD